MELEDRKKLLDRSQEANDRYRDRAKSLANLTGAAAGALAAGLVLSPSDSLNQPARVLGLVAILMLLIATGLFATAHAVRGVHRRNRLITVASYVFRPWIAFQDAASQSDEVGRIAHLQSSSDAILKRMARLSDIALVASGGALIALSVALGFASFYSPPSQAVAVHASEVLVVPGCGQLSNPFRANVLFSSDEQLTLEISPEVCDSLPVARVTFTIDRSSVALELLE